MKLKGTAISIIMALLFATALLIAGCGGGGSGDGQNAGGNSIGSEGDSGGGPNAGGNTAGSEGGGGTSSGLGGGDVDPPSTPAGLTVEAASSSQINISWTASTDNVAVTGYKIYQNNIYLKSVSTTTASDMGLGATTQYCYHVSAYDAAGNESAKSEQKCGTTLGGGGGRPGGGGGIGPGGGGDVSPPSTPTGLTVWAVSSSEIHIVWTASSDDVGVAGYNVYRGGTLLKRINDTGLADTGLSASTQYCYQVSAYDAAGNESPKSAQQCGTTLTGNNYSLTVSKTGAGSGTVTGTGISCGTDCTHSYASATEVTLTASSDSGSTFAGWSGCDSPSGSTCTLAMDRDKTVTATFETSITASITITGLPATDSDGSYTLTWTVTGLASSPWIIHEDSDTSFSSPATYYSYDTSSPYTYNFGGKADGNYCYRVGLSPSGPFSASACVTVDIAAPEAPVLRIINDLSNIDSQTEPWSQWNQIIRVRIGPKINVVGAECNSVTTSTTYERLNPYDNRPLPGPSITPGYANPTDLLNRKDFDVSDFASGEYCVFIQAGWWEYYWSGWSNDPGSFTIHPTSSYNCAGTPVYDNKWNVFMVSGHTSGTFSVNVSDWLPHYSWYGSSFCN